MADYIIDGAILSDIANVIRQQTGDTEPITPETMAYKVAECTGGGSEDLNAVLTEQENLIDELKAVLAEKASGGSATAEDLVFVFGDGTQLDASSVESIATSSGFVQSVICGNEILWQDALPSEYQRVSYLESTGTQYIDTGFIASVNSGFDVRGDFDYHSSTTRFGARELVSGNSNIGAFGVMAIGGDKFRVVYGSGLLTATQWEPTQQKRSNRFVFDGVSKTATIYFVDGTSANSTFAVNELTLNFTTTLFAFNNAGTPMFATSMKISSCKLYDGSALVRDLIPCYRKSDGEVGMYDLVTDTFFTNAGTGEFLYAEKATEADYQAALREMGVDV